MTRAHEAQEKGNAAAPWQPRIAAFVCRWCTYAGADLAGTSRLKYPPQIRIIKLPCTGRIDPLFLIRAFRMGADGVLVSGCHPGDCHYTSGNYVARRRWTLFRELLTFVGVEPERLHFSWVSAAEGAKFVDVVKTVTESIRSVGPFRGFEPSRDLVVPIGLNGRPSAPADAGSGAPRELEAIKADLASGEVQAVIGYREGRIAGALTPVWIAHPDAASRLRYRDGALPSLVTYVVRRLRSEPEGVFGVLAGPKDALAIERLVAEQQIDRARVKVYAQDGAGLDDTVREAWEVYPVPGLDRPARERWAFWSAQFAACVRCNACREACPMCTCVRCVQEKTRPRWIESSPTPAGNWAWNVTRAFHLGGRCVDCGGCTESCPSGIPLGALNLHMHNVALRSFGPAPAEDHRSPLVRFRVEDEAPFIL